MRREGERGKERGVRGREGGGGEGEGEGRGRGEGGERERVEGKVEGRECTYLELLFNRPTNSLKSM